MLSVLYVDDEPFLLNAGKIYLERRPDISVSVASSVENALKLIESSSFDVIISDYQMPGTDGIGFLKILREKCCATPFILFTGREREEVLTETLEYGAMIYLQKGGNPRSRFTELEQKIREACGRYPAEGLVQEKRLQYNTALCGGLSCSYLINTGPIIRLTCSVVRFFPPHQFLPKGKSGGSRCSTGHKDAGDGPRMRIPFPLFITGILFPQTS